MGACTLVWNSRCTHSRASKKQHADIEPAIASMHRGSGVTDLPPDVFTLIVDLLLPTSGDGKRADQLDFACLRLSSRGVRSLCDAAVRRLDLRHRSSDEMQALLHRFKGTVLLASRPERINTNQECEAV